MVRPSTSDALDRLELTPAVLRSIRLTPTLAVRVREGQLCCHVVTAGSCILEVVGALQPIALEARDVVVSRAGHQLSDAPGRSAVPLETVPGLPNEADRRGPAGARAVLVSAAFPELPDEGAALLSVLPRTIVLRAWSAAEAFGLDAAIAARVQLALLAALTASIAALPQSDQRLLAALGDSQIGAALGTILRHPAASQSVARLARAVHMSRSAFAARFTASVGQPPLHCQLERRMRRACELLHEARSDLKQIAALVGYGTTASFSHAFKRWSGMAPGEFRREGDDAFRRSVAVVGTPGDAVVPTERSRQPVAPAMPVRPRSGRLRDR
jgi:AraC-like DNA-binding protein